MSWEGKQESAEVKAEGTEPEKPPVTEPNAEPKPEEKPEEKPEPPKEEMVPQKLLGQVAKRIREKSRGEISEKDTRIKALEEENRRLKEGDPVVEANAEEDARIAQKVRDDFLRRQDAYGKNKYGEETYADALLLVNQQNDPLLIAKIQGAASPADTLIEEAARLAEEIELGATPAERKRKQREALKAEVRKEVEAEFEEKLKARNNQPTDVKSVRSAGGNERAKTTDTWATTLPR